MAAVPSRSGWSGSASSVDRSPPRRPRCPGHDHVRLPVRLQGHPIRPAASQSAPSSTHAPPLPGSWVSTRLYSELAFPYSRSVE